MVGRIIAQRHTSLVERLPHHIAFISRRKHDFRPFARSPFGHSSIFRNIRTTESDLPFQYCLRLTVCDRQLRNYSSLPVSHKHLYHDRRHATLLHALHYHDPPQKRQHGLQHRTESNHLPRHPRCGCARVLRLRHLSLLRRRRRR